MSAPVDQYKLWHLSWGSWHVSSIVNCTRTKLTEKLLCENLVFLREAAGLYKRFLFGVSFSLSSCGTPSKYVVSYSLSSFGTKRGFMLGKFDHSTSLKNGCCLIWSTLSTPIRVVAELKNLMMQCWVKSIDLHIKLKFVLLDQICRFSTEVGNDIFFDYFG